MRTIIVLIFMLFFSISSLAQVPETFDILTFRVPKGWNKQAGQNAIQISTADNTNFCLITLYKSVPGFSSAKENFAAAWETLVKEAVNVSTAPHMFPPDNKEDWKIVGGFAPFEKDGAKGVAMLYTATGYGKMVNALILTNTQAYEATITAFLESISLKKLDTNSQPQIEIKTNNVNILGSWGKSNAVSQLNNRFGTYSYNKQQYRFNSDGTYNFTGKNYSEAYDETLLIKESGTYAISGNNLTVTPRSSVIEAWGKKNGGDNWNKLKTSQKRPLEKTTYQFAIQENNLVLQAAQETVRDGHFNTGNFYYYGPPGTFTPIKLPGE